MIYVTVMATGHLKVGRFPFFKKHIFTGNATPIYKELGIPINKILKVSNAPFKGASEIKRLPEYPWGCYGKEGHTSIHLCTWELINYFKKVPDKLYWKAL